MWPSLGEKVWIVISGELFDDFLCQTCVQLTSWDAYDAYGRLDAKEFLWANTMLGLDGSGFRCAWLWWPSGFSWTKPTLCLYHMAMENGPHIDGLRWFTKQKWCSYMATINYQRVNDLGNLKICVPSLQKNIRFHVPSAASACQPGLTSDEVDTIHTSSIEYFLMSTYVSMCLICAILKKLLTPFTKDLFTLPDLEWSTIVVSTLIIFLGSYTLFSDYDPMLDE